MVNRIPFIIILALLLSGCQFAPSPPLEEARQLGKDMGDSKKILMVIAPKDFRDEEYQEPRDILENNGYDIEVASIQTGAATGMQGTEAEIDITTSEVDPYRYQAVVFVGGPGMKQILGDNTLEMLAENFYQANKLTTAICIAPVILANTGLLENKKATSYEDGRESLLSNGADFLEENVVVDGNIITANGPQAATEFAQAILSELN